MFANPMMEQLNRKALQEYQLKLLKKQIHWAEEKVPLYRKAFHQAGVLGKTIECLEEIQQYPFLTSEDLRRADVFDCVALPLSGIIRYDSLDMQTSGVSWMYTRGDIAHNLDMLTRAMVAGGMHNASIVGILGDLSNSRMLDVIQASEAIGATAIIMGPDYNRWARIVQKLQMDIMIGASQSIMQLIIQLQGNGLNISSTALRSVFCMNEGSIQNPMQRHIQERMQARVFNLYAPAGLGMAGMLYQCAERIGQHIQEDYFYPEIVAFNSDTPIDDSNQMGELVITSLQAEAMPLIRYRTGQAISLKKDTCACGRTHLRILTPFRIV